MAEDFDRLMDEKMEGASLQEVMPGFDREAVWNELDGRLPRQPKKKALPLWWTHAAAVAAGIVVGALLLHALSVPEPYTGETAKTTTGTRPAPPTVIVKRDTVLVPAAPIAQPGAIAAEPNKSPARRQAVPAQETMATETPVMDTPQPGAEKAMEQQPIAQVQPKKAKAVHLLDIDNENRQAALYHNDPATHPRTGFVLQISARRLPDNNPQQQPGTLIKELLK